MIQGGGESEEPGERNPGDDGVPLSAAVARVNMPSPTLEVAGHIDQELTRYDNLQSHHRVAGS